jgi:imidazolonepropionase-like amidohydrolase
VPQLIVRDVTVIDVAAGQAFGPRTIVIRDGRIEAIATTGTANDTPSLDGAGLFAMPGLIDAHVHLFFDGGAAPLSMYKASNDQGRLTTARQNAERALSAGVTTVRDLGAPPDLMSVLQNEVGSGRSRGPHIVSSGAPLTRPGGHCHFFGGEVTTSAEVREVIERQSSQGATCVKVMASGGGMTAGTRPSEADFPLELMTTAREVADMNGMTITAHCHATAAINRAISAGIRCLEHVSFMEPSGHPRFDRETGMRLKESGAVACPTVASGQRAARLFRREGHGYHADDIGALERLEARGPIAAELHGLGVPLIAGSDAGSDDTPFDVVIEEIEALHEAGVARSEALRSATSESARHLSLRDRGEIKVGYVADMLLLAADPLRDLTALRSPLAVIRSGEVVADGR